jgi:hypothetical protein
MVTVRNIEVMSDKFYIIKTCIPQKKNMETHRNASQYCITIYFCVLTVSPYSRTFKLLKEIRCRKLFLDSYAHNSCKRSYYRILTMVYNFQKY